MNIEYYRLNLLVKVENEKKKMYFRKPSEKFLGKFYLQYDKIKWMVTLWFTVVSNATRLWLFIT